jgi:HAD superfamily hydrolase (TIGR01509 family)
MKYKAIGFDWNGVLFGTPGSVFSQGAADVIGVDIVTFRRAYFENNHLVNKEGASKEVFWAAVLEDLRMSEKLSVLLNYLNSIPKGRINDDVVEVVKLLKEAGLKLGLVSNETIEGGERIKQTEVAKYFDEILISSEVGFMKPQKELFDMLLSKLEVLPEELVFVDDAEKSLEKSGEIGFTPVLFRNSEELIKSLSELGILKK